jgi:hypothetical protein
LSKNVIAFAAAAAACFVATPSTAQSGDGDIYGRVGVYFTGSDTRIRLDDLATADPGSEIKFEKDLNLDNDSTTLRGEVGVRLSDHWALEFQYVRLRRTSTANIDRTIVVEDKVFDLNASIEGGFRSSIYHGRAVWTVADWENGNIDLSLGLHATNFAISIAGEVQSANGLEFASIERKQLAPLPTIGARVNFSAAPDIRLFARTEIFGLKINEFDGRLLDAEAGVVWDFSNNIGVGASWYIVDYSLDVTKNDLRGSVDYTMSGPMIFATFAF